MSTFATTIFLLTAQPAAMPQYTPACIVNEVPNCPNGTYWNSMRCKCCRLGRRGRVNPRYC
jgi:hypothetical protein